MNEYKYIGKEMVLDVIKARGRYLGDAEIMNSMDKTALDQIEGYKMALDSIAEDINNIPPVNVHPVKRGKWIEVTPKHSRCSVCDTTCLIAVYPISKGANYCPNCGADMRGNADEQP